MSSVPLPCTFGIRADNPTSLEAAQAHWSLSGSWNTSDRARHRYCPLPCNCGYRAEHDCSVMTTVGKWRPRNHYGDSIREGREVCTSNAPPLLSWRKLHQCSRNGKRPQPESSSKNPVRICEVKCQILENHQLMLQLWNRCISLKGHWILSFTNTWCSEMSVNTGFQDNWQSSIGTVDCKLA